MQADISKFKISFINIEFFAKSFFVILMTFSFHPFLVGCNNSPTESVNVRAISITIDSSSFTVDVESSPLTLVATVLSFFVPSKKDDPQVVEEQVNLLFFS